MTEQTTGQRIAQCRKQLGLSQEGLGERVGVSRQAISKWEADAAMPDIDKLISLSKLFSVSVGWLLGVEEKPEPQPESPQISDELLRKIEEVVRRYQPRKKRAFWKLAAAALAAAVLIWGGWQFSEEWYLLQVRLSQLSSMISSRDDSHILSQLDQLEDRIDGINDTIEKADAVLAGYEFRLTPDPESDTVRMYLNIVPKTWNERWSATLSVRFDGSQAMSQTCAWDGSALISSLELSLLDGYTFWLVIQYPDGSQEQVALSDQEAENLKSTMQITCQLYSGDIGGFNLSENFILLSGYEVYLRRPESLASAPKNQWTRAELVLYHVRGGVRSLADSHSLLHSGDTGDLELYTYPEQWRFTIPQVEPGDQLELWIEAELENGLSLSEIAGVWTYGQNGFIPTW